MSKIIDAARESVSHSVNAAMTAAYWLVGRRIIEFEQSGEERCSILSLLLSRLADDLTRRFGRGFSRQSIEYAYVLPLVSFLDRFPRHRLANSCSLPDSRYARRRLAYPKPPRNKWHSPTSLQPFRYPGSGYVRPLSVRIESAREFNEVEALRGGWSVRQLTDRSVLSSTHVQPSLRIRPQC